MKKYLLSISFLIIALFVLFTLINCGGSDTTTPCIPPKAPTVKTSIKINAGESIALTATSTEASAAFKWTGPNSYTSTLQNPTIANATEAMAGNYLCTVTVAGCTSRSDTTLVLIQGVLTDPKDGHVYKTIKIGTQTWMAENFQWQSPSDYADYKVYDGLPANGPIYGMLYDWILAQKCDDGITGWRLPTQSDFELMVSYLGGYLIAGAKLKEAGTGHWATPNYGATNSSGFTALGGGYYDVINSLGYQDKNNRAYFWTKTPFQGAIVYFTLRTEDNWSRIEWTTVSPQCNFYSVRLIKN